jgi:hypothetical protein
MSPEAEVPATWRLREDRDEIGLANEALTDPSSTPRERYLAERLRDAGEKLDYLRNRFLHSYDAHL